MIGADLSWIFNCGRRGTTTCQKINRQRSGIASNCRRRRHGTSTDFSPATEKPVLAPHVELIIPLHVVALAIDIGDVIPKPEDIGEFQPIGEIEDCLISRLGGLLQWRL